MTRKISITRRWLEAPPIGRDGRPIPEHLWPRRRKHCWEVRWFAHGPNGKVVRPSKTFPCRDDAEQFAATKRVEFENRSESRHVKPKITLGHFAEEFVKLRTGPRGQRLKIATVNLYKRSLDTLSGFLGKDKCLVDISSADVARFLAGLREDKERQVCTATRNKIKRSLKAVFSMAVAPMGHIRDNPFRGFKADKVTDSPIRYVTPVEFKKLLAACNETDRPVWWRALLIVCYTAGLRSGEALNLTWGDLDFAKETIRVSAKPDGSETIEWSPKDYEMRLIPVPAETMTALAELQAVSPDRHPYVFIPPQRLATIRAAKKMGVWKETTAVMNNFQRAWRAIVVRASQVQGSLLNADGSPSITIHDLRRSAITNWSRAANIQTVMKMAGHSNIETTRRYYAAATEDQLKKVRLASSEALRGAQSDAKLTQNG